MTTMTSEVVLDLEDDSDAHALTCHCDECCENRVLDMLEDRAA